MFLVVLFRGWLARYAFFLRKPFTKIDQLAAFTAKWTPALLGFPGHGAAAGRAGDVKRLRIHIRQVLREKGTSRSAWVGCCQSVQSMKRMLKRCLPPLISA